LDAPVEMEAPQLEEETPSPVEVGPEPPEALSEPAVVRAAAAPAVSEPAEPGSLLSVTGRFGVLSFNSDVMGSVEQSSDVVVDADGALFQAGPVVQTRLLPSLSWFSDTWLHPFVFKADVEADLLAGPAVSAPTLAGEGFPGSGELESVVRKANFTLSFAGRLNLTGGLTTSHWGLGLVANDGAHGWTPGSARFTHPVGGDRVLRTMLSFAPITGVPLLVAVARDLQAEDDAVLDGDEARQWIAAVRFGPPEGGSSAGLYVVSRHQRSRDGTETIVLVADVTGATSLSLGRARLDLAGEVALIHGGTGLGPTTGHPEHDMLSLGGVLRAGLDLGSWGVALDAVYASGDQNLDDGSLNAFKADRNFHQGLVLYRQLLASQTARAPHTASDPDLSGVPAPDLERLPTYGAVTNTVSFFPRIWWRPLSGLEIYGGPLLALSESGLADPLQTRLNGGVSTNATGGSPGSLLGTEIDLGVRLNGSLGGVELGLGVEGGLLLPGSAFQDDSGEPMEPLMGARALLEGRL